MLVSTKGRYALRVMLELAQCLADSFTPLPVIGVPMKTSDLGGMDSLLSMVQMPSGVPVACVAINGAKNAAIYATQILGACDPEYRKVIEKMKQEMADA